VSLISSNPCTTGGVLETPIQFQGRLESLQRVAWEVGGDVVKWLCRKEGGVKLVDSTMTLCVEARRCYMDTSLMRNTPPVGPYSSPTPRDLG